MHWSPDRPRRLAAAVGVLLLAASVRLWRLSELPPGLYYDEAGHLLAAQSIGRDGRFPVYFEFGEGNDPLFAYLARINLAVLGAVPWAGRLVSAWAGLLSIAAMIRMGPAIFHQRSIGLLAGLLAAGLFWHLGLSRYGTQPMLAGALTTGSVLAFWLAARRPSRGAPQYLLGGLLLGLALVTYVAVRLFVVVPAALVTLGLLRQRPRRPALIGIALSGAVCGLVILPQALFFISNPVAFTDRFRATTSDTLSSADPPRALARNLARVAGGLMTAGPIDPRQNLPGRPALDLMQVPLLLIGIATLAASPPANRRAVVLVGAWLVVGLLPAVITENPPNFQRSVMAIPPLCIIMASGFVWLWGRLPLAFASRPLLVVLLGLSTAGHLHAYFVRWANDPATAMAFDAGHYWIARQLRSAPPGHALYETPVPREWLTFEFGLGPEAFARFRDFNGRACLVLPAAAATGATFAVITAEDAFSLPALQSAYPAGSVVAEYAVGGTPYASLFTVPAGAMVRIEPPQPLPATFSEQIALLGYSVDSADHRAGQPVRLRLFWRMLRDTTADLHFFAHVLGHLRADGSPLHAQRDSQPCDNSYPTWQWAPGELLIDRVDLPIPTDTPPGLYHLNVGWYDSASLQRLDAIDAAGLPLGNTLELQVLAIAAP